MSNIKLALSNIGYDSYQEYLGSAHWLNLVETMKEKLGEKCEVESCKEIKSLQVHHINYRTLGNENFRDVVLICKKHHKEAHNTNNESIKKVIRRYIEWEE
jgi:5-methylcytosine-specific restriction endonuclease McrA